MASAGSSVVNTNGNGATGENGSAGTSGGSAAKHHTVERRCENAECNVAKLVSMVPKRKSVQFVSEPNIMEKPLLINGFTTVFQVDGSSAKLSDLKNPDPNGEQQPKTIYRIIPNTHAHIVNYVVVDADGESLRKINDNDPATMRKLIQSQKVSAGQMLKKLMAGHGPQTSKTATTKAPATAAATTTTTAAAAAAAATVSPSTGGRSATVNPPLLPTVQRQGAANVAGNSSFPPITATIGASGSGSASSPPSSSTSVSVSANIPTSPAIKLPVRMHPNLKITAVASGDNIGALNASSSAPIHPPPPTQPTIPLITPVPIANLQNQPVLPTIPQTIGTIPVDAVDKPVFDKMQAEIQELRRTVAMLAEAQAKNQQLSPKSSIVPQMQVKKPVLASKRMRPNNN